MSTKPTLPGAESPDSLDPVLGVKELVSPESQKSQWLARATEQLRQERETFDQAKQHEGRWFVLRLVMGYFAVILLPAIMIVASYILFNAAMFPTGVVTAAGVALFVGALGLLVTVWKIALNPNFYARLDPVTRVTLPETQPKNEVAAIAKAEAKPDPELRAYPNNFDC